MRRRFDPLHGFIGLTWGLVFLHVAVFLMTQADSLGAYRAFALEPGVFASGRLWTLFTYQFLNGSTLSLFFNVLSLFFLALPLEEEWGSARFTAFYLVSVFSASLSAAVLGIGLAGSVFLGASFLLTYALIWPEQQFLVFFVIPVKVRWIAIFTAAVLVLQAFSLGLFRGIVHLVGMVGGLLFYLLAIRANWRSIRRRGGSALEEGLRARDDERLDEKNRSLFERASRVARPLVPDASVGDEVTRLVADLDGASSTAVSICKPVDYKGNLDPTCIRCEGFPNCTLRFLRGEPPEITPPLVGPD